MKWLHRILWLSLHSTLYLLTLGAVIPRAIAVAMEFAVDAFGSHGFVSTTEN